jgi:hypothetical protein
VYGAVPPEAESCRLTAEPVLPDWLPAAGAAGLVTGLVTVTPPMEPLAVKATVPFGAPQEPLLPLVTSNRFPGVRAYG